MAKKILVNYDFGKLESYNFRLQNLAADPSSPAPGQAYYKTADSTFRFYNGTSFLNLLDRANHIGTQPAATISDFNTAVRTNSLSQLAAPTGDLSAAGFKITSLADPVSAQDAASKNYVDAAVNGLDWKQSVRAVSTSNVAAFSGLQTIDGITLVAGDRVLLAGQATASQNGIWVASSGTWIRSIDANSSAKVTSGLAVMITEGVVNADTQWRLTTNDAIVIDSTALVFVQIGSATSYAQGTGILISSNVVSIDTAVVVRKVAFAIGDGASSSYSLSHNLGNLDVIVQVFENSTGQDVEADITRTSVNACTIAFAAPIGPNYRVVIQG